MSELEAGKAAFLEVVRLIDPQVSVVIPVTSSNDLFLISLTKGKNRKFITIPEDNLLDLPSDRTAMKEILKQVQDTITSFEA